MLSNATFLTDFYKVGHIDQYHSDTKLIFSNFTPRSTKLFSHFIDDDRRIVVFGLSGVIQDYLINYWNDNFFSRKKYEVINEYKELVSRGLGIKNPYTLHIEKLHNLGYLPLCINALPEGSLIDEQIPMFTIYNTHPDFYWLVNYLETPLSSELWKSSVNATISYNYKKLCQKYSDDTCDNDNHIPYQCHDFSYRGLCGHEDASKSGAAHLVFFNGTDNIPAIQYTNKYYNNNFEVGHSIPASEHSVATTNICYIEEVLKETNKYKKYSLEYLKEGIEEDNYKLLAEKAFILEYINHIYPSGIVSYVADSYDYWSILTKVLPSIKDNILSRDGKMVLRPDSGNPIDIICGDEYSNTEHERIGSIELLWNIFGGTVNSKGYKVLDSHIGLIYGDSITLERAKIILQKLKDKGFASSNVVFGIGSFTYNYSTRDTLGFAVKATGAIIGDKELSIVKDPKTDSTKKSAKGFLKVIKEDNTFKLIDNIPFKDINIDSTLVEVFNNGNIKVDSLREIRNRL